MCRSMVRLTSSFLFSQSAYPWSSDLIGNMPPDYPTRLISRRYIELCRENFFAAGTIGSGEFPVQVPTKPAGTPSCDGSGQRSAGSAAFGIGRVGNRLGQLEQALADLRVGDPVISTDQFQRLALGHRVRFERTGLFLAETTRRAVRNRNAARIGRHIVEEERDRHIEYATQVEQ